MKAGRELDILVAEKIMSQFVMREGEWGTHPDWMTVDGRYEQIPHYSTDIAAAWEVVEEMHKQGLNITLGKGPYDWWSCRFLLRSDGKTFWQESDVDSAPLAICLVALKVVENRH